MGHRACLLSSTICKMALYPRSCPNNNGDYSVLSACCMLGIMLSAAQTLSHLIITYPYEVENLIPIVAIRKLKLR